MKTQLIRSRNETKKVLFGILDRLEIKHQRGGYYFTVYGLNECQIKKIVDETGRNNIRCEVKNGDVYFDTNLNLS